LIGRKKGREGERKRGRETLKEFIKRQKEEEKKRKQPKVLRQKGVGFRLPIFPSFPKKAFYSF
jgi:hypothetical protein